ncbi:hypothetical protein MTO96_001682 [Rhipicephalus appendiculatus]
MSREASQEVVDSGGARPPIRSLFIFFFSPKGVCIELNVLRNFAQRAVSGETRKRAGWAALTRRVDATTKGRRSREERVNPDLGGERAVSAAAEATFARKYDSVSRGNSKAAHCARQRKRRRDPA